ncbi:MAG: SusC/RagA family TonB-linked outer membrane protein [Flavobacteriaceae bacterium]|nr:SusC/RagA family TonB-linked outer membrane protein [Flavobacteriaceae bacterium]
MRTRNLIFSVFTLLLFASFAYAQVRGVVVDDFGPVSGAVVTVDQTGVSTETGDDGAFSITASVGNTLTILNPNTLAEKQFNVTGTNLGNLNLVDAATVLTDVITLGYSTTTQEAYTGTADVVDASQIEKKSVSNISQALAGESAGVRVVNSSGQPGTVATIQIRGIGSVNATTRPLYVVDGIPFDGDISSISPGDIENTVILKDATATAIYGARGANGVIVINTKKGRKGRSEVVFESKVGFNDNFIPRYDVITSPERYLELGWEGMKNYAALTGQADPAAWASANLYGGSRGLAPLYNIWNVAGNQLINPATGLMNSNVQRRFSPENWADHAFSPGIRTENTVSFRSGGDKTSIFSSFSYLDEKGYSLKSDYDRLSTRLNVNHEIASWLNASVNLGYSFSDTNNNGQSEDSGSIFWFADNIPSIYPLFLYDFDGNRVVDPIYGGFQYDYGFGENTGRRFGANTNAVADAMYNLMNAKSHDFNTNVSFIMDIFKGLTLETRFGSQYYNWLYNDLSNPYYGSAAQDAQARGSIYKDHQQMISYNALQLLRYENRFGTNHQIEVMLGHENNAQQHNRTYGYRSGLVIPTITEWNNAIKFGSMGSYGNKASLESYFAQANYNFARKYYLTVTGRADGSSRFINNKWGDFYSVGAAWIISREDFLANQNSINHLKLKASYGTTGEQRGLGYYPWANLYTSGTAGDYEFTETTVGNPDLTWESSQMLQAGIEMGFWNRVDLNVDFYNKKTTNLLFERRVALSQGYAIFNINDGELLNRGIEFDLKSHLVRNNNFNLTFGINGELLHNELTKMPIEPTTGLEKHIDIAGNYGRSAGRSLYDFYIREWAGVDPETGSAMWNRYFDDANSNGVFDEGDTSISSMTQYLHDNPGANVAMETTTNWAVATQKYVDKSAIPDVRGAFNLGAQYKNIDFSIQMLYSLGGYSYDGAYAGLMHNRQIGGNNWHKDIEQRWQQPGDITNVPRLSDNLTGDTQFNAVSTRFLTKSDYLVLNNVRLGYTFPSDMMNAIGVGELGVFVQGDNLALWSARKGFDPSTSISGASDMYRYNPLSTITMGLRVKL